MTKEEFKQLQPGDKVILSEDEVYCPGTPYAKAIELQNQQGGYLIASGFEYNFDWLKIEGLEESFWYKWFSPYSKKE